VNYELVRSLLEQAKRAPSGGNLQPWKLYVLSGSSRAALVDAVREKIAANPEAAIAGEIAEYKIYPPDLPEPYASRRLRVGAQLYEAVGIGRGDRAGRLRQLARNYEFFGAPVGIIVTIERFMQPGQFVDLGLFLQSLALLAVEQGLATCMQESWANWHATIRRVVGVPESELVFCGVSLGYPDLQHPINQFVTERANLEEFAQFAGF
jgi:nitroreductase